MNEQEIVRLVNRVRGMMPQTGVPKDTVIDSWSSDKWLRTVELTFAQKDALLAEIEKLEAWPTLKQLKAFVMMSMATPEIDAIDRCGICGDTGWDTGLRLHAHETQKGNKYAYQVASDFNTTDLHGHTYTQVTPCECSKGKMRRAKWVTLKPHNN